MRKNKNTKWRLLVFQIHLQTMAERENNEKKNNKTVIGNKKTSSLKKENHFSMDLNITRFFFCYWFCKRTMYNNMINF